MTSGVHRAGLGMALAVGLMLAWPRAGSAQAETMPPPDRARLSPPVRAAIAQFERIVAKRDLAALERHVEPGAKMSFGGRTLREVWKPESPDTGLWRELEDILRLGGVETVDDVSGTREWGAPYTAWTAFGTDADGEQIVFDTLIVVGTGVALRAAPTPDARILDRVDHAVLRIGDNASDCDWEGDWSCVLWHGRRAYVHSSLVRSPIGHRLLVRVEDDGGWQIQHFVAGD